MRVHVEGRDRLPAGPAIYCFNHLGWVDPFVLMAVLPMRPRLFFFGPKEEDMRVGARNRVMAWTGTPIPFRPEKDDLLRVTRRVQAVLAGGAVMAIAGEGRIHASESELWPLNEGTGVLRPASVGPDRADRDQRDELAAFPGEGHGQGGGAAGGGRPSRSRDGRRPDPPDLGGPP